MNPGDYEFLRVEREGHLLVVTIRRAQVLNALHPAATRELAHVFDAYESDKDLWVAILTAEGDRAFCVGNDLKHRSPPGEQWELPLSGFGGLTARYDMVKPVIAAVNGVAAGGGFELALACDLIIAAEHAAFTLPEVRLGLAALAGGVHRLPRSIGLHQAMGIVLTGRKVSAKEGKSLGFVNEVVEGPDLMDAARRWADEITAASPMSVRASKQAMNCGLDQPSLRAATEAHYPAVAELLDSEDFQEGPAAFLERRTPSWTSL
jgi:enoyl-CoA hydratase/carnithine racemase